MTSDDVYERTVQSGQKIMSGELSEMQIGASYVGCILRLVKFMNAVIIHAVGHVET